MHPCSPFYSRVKRALSLTFEMRFQHSVGLNQNICSFVGKSSALFSMSTVCCFACVDSAEPEAPKPLDLLANLQISAPKESKSVDDVRCLVSLTYVLDSLRHATVSYTTPDVLENNLILILRVACTMLCSAPRRGIQNFSDRRCPQAPR